MGSTKGFAQQDDFITRLKSQLFFYRTQNAIQTVEVQTDKALYRQGEELWFKGFVIDPLTKNLSLSSLSITLQLTDEGGNTISEGVFTLENGRTKGCFPLPIDLPNGLYRLLAYTPEMTNDSPTNVFCKKIVICRPENLDVTGEINFRKEVLDPASREVALLNLKALTGKSAAGEKYEYSVLAGSKELVSGKGKTDQNGKGEIIFFTPSAEISAPTLMTVELQSGVNELKLKKKIPVTSEKINLFFYPEGGNLVSGIPQLVIFEAKDQLGNPSSVVADILAEDGSFVAKAMTMRPGLGVFHLMNQNTQPLKFRITSELGKDQETVLPMPLNEAMAISVKKNDGANLGVMLAPSTNSTITNYAIVALSGGEMVWASEFEMTKAGLINIPLENFHHDIANLAIFDLNGNLLCERLVFTGKGKSPAMTVQTDKKTYLQEGEGTIKIKVLDADGKPVRSELSLSLADTTTLLSMDQSMIRRINHGLVKPIPENLTTSVSDKLMLDYLLIANKMKGLNWNIIALVDPVKPTPINQYSTRVSGKVVGPDGKSIPNAMISFSTILLQQFSGRSNAEGDFELNIPARVDRKNLSASATDSNGKGNYKVVLNNSFKEELEIYLKNNPALPDWGFIQELNTYLAANPDFAKATPASKIRSSTKTTNSSLSNYLRDATSMMEVVKFIRPFEIISGKIVFRGANSINAQDGALIVVDGQKQGSDPSLLANISPKDVADVKILLDPIDMSRYTSLNSVGIIEITMKRGEDIAKEIASKDNGAEAKMNKDFVATPIGNEKFKLITTPLWSPNVVTDEQGEATVKFSLGRIKSGFRLTATGFTDQGEWVETTELIEVK